jgi:hypothetical protein
VSYHRIRPGCGYCGYHNLFNGRDTCGVCGDWIGPKAVEPPKETEMHEQGESRLHVRQVVEEFLDNPSVAAGQAAVQAMRDHLELGLKYGPEDTDVGKAWGDFLRGLDPEESPPESDVAFFAGWDAAIARSIELAKRGRSS